MQNTIVVTGGAGFIGSNFILGELILRELGKHAGSSLGTAGSGGAIVNLDKLTYAGNLCNLESVANDSRYEFVHGDIGDRRRGSQFHLGRNCGEQAGVSLSKLCKAVRGIR